MLVMDSLSSFIVYIKFLTDLEVLDSIGEKVL